MALLPSTSALSLPDGVVALSLGEATFFREVGLVERPAHSRQPAANLLALRIVDAAQAQGLPIDIKIYPGALHAFDSASPVRTIAERVNQNAPGGRGATTGGNRAAWDDAVKRVLDFFAARVAAVK